MIPTKSNLISFSLGCIIMLVVAYKFMPKPVPQAPSALLSQDQVTNCKAIVTKRTNRDGSVDEIAEFLSTNSQKQQLATTPSKETVDIYAGVGTDLKGSISVKYGKYLHQVISDGDKNHAYHINYKVLEF